MRAYEMVDKAVGLMSSLETEASGRLSPETRAAIRNQAAVWGLLALAETAIGKVWVNGGRPKDA